MQKPSYYIDSEDFKANSKASKGGKSNKKKGSSDGKYTSKHVRISLEKKTSTK